MAKSRKRRTSKNRSKSRKQKLWNQKGCSHSKCNSCNKCHMCSKHSKCLHGGDASIAPLAVFNNGTVGIRGGSTCGTCMNENCSCADPSQAMMGGSGIFGGLIPGPIVGNVWGSQPSELPGANGVGGDRNLLPYNTYQPVDISRQMALRGGMRSNRRNKRSKRNGNKAKALKGGGIMPQDLLNLGRDFAFNMESAYNSIRGMPAPVNPLPYKDQLMADATKY